MGHDTELLSAVEDLRRHVRAATKALAVIERHLGFEAPKKKRASKSPNHPDTQQAIDLWHRRFERAYGRKPTWDGRTVKMLDALVRKHQLGDVAERIGVLFDQGGRGHLAWLTGPYDIATLSRHFDKLVPMRESTGRAQGPYREWQE